MTKDDTCSCDHSVCETSWHNVGAPCCANCSHTNPDERPAADPVVRVARDLTEIVNLAGHLEINATNMANSRLMPGGRPMVYLCRDASLDEWSELIAAAELRHFAQCEKADHQDCTILGAEHVEDEDDQYQEDPLRTLLFWSEAWREERGFPLGGRRPTISTEAAIIRHLLDWAWENELHWDDFAADINRARRRLEDVVGLARGANRTGVRCSNEGCDRKPHLIRVYGATPDSDSFKCPRCKMRYTMRDYTRAKQIQLHSAGAARYVKSQDARDAIGRPKRTWRKWLRLWYVRSYRDPVTGQVWVWWPDVRDTEMNTQRRTRRVA